MIAIKSCSRLQRRIAFGFNFCTRISTKRPISTSNKLIDERGDSQRTLPKHPYVDKGLHLPCRFNDMSNDSLAVLTALEVEEACEELMKRHIMREDAVGYSEAEEIVRTIAKANREGMFFETIPHGIGIAVAVTAGLASFPLVFHEPSVSWFNERFVTAEVPSAEEIQTFLEVGSWSWNWMEPPLGQISFFILCLQFARGNSENLGINKYTRRIRVARAKKLAERFPKYEPHVLIQYSLSTKYY